MVPMTTAILSALPEEQSSLVALLQAPQRRVHAGRVFWTGMLHGKSVVFPHGLTRRHHTDRVDAER